MDKSKSQRTVTLLLPTFNEIDGLKALFPKIDRSWIDDILIVDGCSTDGTVEYAIENNIRIMTQLRKGLGPAVIDAVATIKTDCVIEFSMDGNCIVEDLPRIVKKLREGYDLVIASRYLPPAKSHDDGFITALGNFMFTRLIRALGKFPMTDSLNMYRGFHIKITKYPEFPKILYGPVFEPLVSAVATARNLKICEIPSDEPKRIGGESKMSVIYNGSCILLMIIRMFVVKWFKLKKEYELVVEE